MSLKVLEVFWDEHNYLFWETSECKGLGHNTFSLDDSIDSFKIMVVFLDTLSKLLNRQTKKKNSIEVISPP
jgi:hypothetical protein